MKYKLYLRNKPQKDQFLGEYQTVEEVKDRIDKWLNVHTYHCHYFRYFKTNGGYTIDFGDWHKFFYVKVVE